MAGSDDASGGLAEEGVLLLTLLPHLVGLSFVLGITSLVLDKMVKLKVIKSKPSAVKELIVSYDMARPGLPEPNELKELSKSTGKGIEELNQWFRLAKAHDRSLVVAERMHEALMRMLLLVGCCAAVIARQNAVLTQTEADVIRMALYFQIFMLHLVAFNGTKIREFSLIGVEILVRMGLIVVVPLDLSELISLTHDSVDYIFESSKFLQLAGHYSVASFTFFMFFLAWSILRVGIFSQGLFESGVFSLVSNGSLTGVSAVLLSILCLFDVWGLSQVLKLAYSGFWAANVTPRKSRSDSLSSNTSMEYDSDSSLSSNLRWDKYKDE